MNKRILPLLSSTHTTSTLLIALLSLVIVQSSFADGNGLCMNCTVPDGVNVSGSRTDNKIYAGLVWTLNQQLSYLPDLSIGFRSLKVNSNDDVYGGDFNGRVSFKSGLAVDSFRLLYVGGNRDIQGNLGGGYSFNQKSLLASGAVEGSYIKVGSDFMVRDMSFLPYVEFNSIGKPKKIVVNENLSCPSGVLTSVSDFQADGWFDPPYVESQYVRSGYTCEHLPSDRRLKNSIHSIAKLTSGMKIYSFKYNWSNETYVGVMAQDLLNNKVLKKSVVTMPNGFYGVNYTSLGLKMTTLNNWNKEGLNSIQLH